MYGAPGQIRTDVDQRSLAYKASALIRYATGAYIGGRPGIRTQKAFQLRHAIEIAVNVFISFLLYKYCTIIFHKNQKVL